MYHFKRIIFLVFCLPLLAIGSDTTVRKAGPVYRNTVMLGFNYGRQAPIGILAKRYGASNTVGFSVGYKLGRNWQVQAAVNTLFSGKVKENSILDSMIGDGGLLLDLNGTYAEVRMYQRGYHWHADIGKIIPLGNFDRNSGLLLSAGLGFMEHKIKFTFQRTVLPQLENDYYKGYDRLTNGFMLRGFAGYQRIDPKGMFNFFGGVELLNGFTKNRRTYNYDTRQAETALRNDLLLGIKFGVMITLNGRQAGDKKGEEERFFQ